MRVALVTPYDQAVPGGVPEHIWNLSAHLVRRGHDVHVIAPSSRPIAIPGVRVHVATSRVLPVRVNGATARVALGPAAAGRVVGVIARIDADVVHVHEPCVPLLGPAAVFASRAPVVATFHAARDGRRTKPTWLGAALVAIARRIDRAIAVSDVARLTAGTYFRRGIEVVPNGVDVASFEGARERPEAFHDGKPCVLTLGRLDPRKGHAVLVEAFGRDKHLRTRARLVVAGPYSAREAVAWTQSCARAGIEDVRLVGELDRDARASYLRHASVTCAPATGNESQGVVLLEAMAACSPVVAAANAGYRGLVIHGVNGLLVEPGDPDALGRTLRVALHDSCLRARLIEAGMVTARAHDWTIVASAVERVYRSSLGRVSATAGAGASIGSDAHVAGRA